MNTATKQAPRTAERTPGPWQLKHDAPTVVLPAGECQRKAAIAQCALSHGLGDAGKADRANAAFIVRACNAHDDLLAAMRNMTNAFQAAVDVAESRNGHESMLDRAQIAIARAVIARAEGK